MKKRSSPAMQNKSYSVSVGMKNTYTPSSDGEGVYVSNTRQAKSKQMSSSPRMQSMQLQQSSPYLEMQGSSNKSKLKQTIVIQYLLLSMFSSALWSTSNVSLMYLYFQLFFRFNERRHADGIYDPPEDGRFLLLRSSLRYGPQHDWGWYRGWCSRVRGDQGAPDNPR